MSQISDLEQDLSLSWRNLQNEWTEVRSEWRDEVAARFEDEWWSELESEMPQLIESVSQLNQVFRQAQMLLSE